MSQQMKLGEKPPKDNTYRQMARAWEAESRSLMLDPNKPSPADTARRRLSEMQAMLNKHPVAGDIT